jgi:hypothetical protein
MRIIVPAIKQYHKNGSKGSYTTEILLRDSNVLGSVSEEFKPMLLEPEFNRIGKNAFDNCIYYSLQNEITRHFTQKRLTEALEYLERMTDERIGRLFRSSDNITAPSILGTSEFSFRVSDRDYNTKSEIFNEFLAELYHTSQDYVIQ